MALLTRTAAEEVIASFTSEEQSRISAQAVLTLANVEKDRHDLFNYALPELAKIRLYNSGIYLSPHSYKPHSHPACKTLENNILFNILPSYLDNSFYLVSIKKNKVDFLKRRHPDLQMIETINRYISSLDKIRYGSFFHVSPSKVSLKFKCDRRTGFETDASLVDLIPGCMEGARKNFFFHDELHYWRKEALITFLDHVKPEIMLASIVYPPEILAGAKESLNPWCYTFKIIDKDLVFFPDGEESEAYIQPLSGSYLLKTSRIVTPSGQVFNLDLIKSSFSHHLISITKGEAIGQKMRFFNGFEAVAMKGLNPLRRKVESCLPISKSTILKIYRYLRTLKKPDLQSAMAKLSQVCKDPNGYEIKFFEEFSKLCLKCDTLNTNMLPDMKRIVQGFFLKLFPNPIARNFKVVQQLHLDNFIETLEDFSFCVPTEELTLNWKDDLEFVNLTFGETDFDLDESFDSTWGVKKDHVNITVVHHAPYLMSKFEAYEYQFHSLLNVDSTAALTRFAKIVVSLYSVSLVESYDCKSLCSLASEVIVSANLRACFTVVDLWKTFRAILIKEGNRSKGRMRKRYFFELGIKWFLFTNAANVKFLTPGRDGLFVRSLNFDRFIKNCQCNLSFHRGRMALHQTIKGERLESLLDEYELNSHKKFVEKQDVRTVEEIEKEQDPHTFENHENSSPATVGCSLVPCACSTNCFVQNAKVDALHNNLTFHDFIGGARGRGATFFSRDLKGYSYTGFSHESRGWPRFLDDFLDDNIIPKHFYDQCLVQEYSTGHGLAMHRDDEEIYDPNHQVLTVNYSGSAIFCIDCDGTDFEVKLNGPQMLLMPFGFQKDHKHGIKNPSKGRISLTFRLSRSASNQVPVQEVVKVDQDGAVKGASLEKLPSQQTQDESMLGTGVSSVFDEGFSADCSGSSPVQEFMIQMDSSLLEYADKSLSGSSKDLINCDLCLCNSPWLKNEELKFSEALRDLAFASGFNPTDRFSLAKGVSGVRGMNRVISELPSHVFPLRGSMSILDIDDKTVKGDVKEGSFSGFRRWKIVSCSTDLVVIAFLKPKVTQGGELRTHEDECELSDLTEKLHGCSVILSRKFEPDLYHSFDVNADGNCFWHSVGPLIGVDGECIKKILHDQAKRDCVKCPRLSKQLENNVWAEREAVAYFCSHYGIKLNVLYAREECTWIFKPHEVLKAATLICQDNHFKPCMPVNGCVIRAIASALNRREVDVLAVLGKPAHEDLFDEVSEGRGFSIFDLSRLFEIFSICGSVDTGGELIMVNEGGRIPAEFSLEKEHLAHIPTLSRRKFSPIVSDLNRVSNSAMRFLAMNGVEVDYRPSIDRASTLLDSFELGATGVLCQGIKETQKNLSSMLVPEAVHDRKLVMILGTFGCGKSSLFKKFIEKSPGKAITFVSPRRSLAESINNDLGLSRAGGKRSGKSKDLKNVRVKTFELFVLHLDSIKEGHTVVIDEIQLFPPGYIDLIILGLKQNVNIIIAGDPCQSDYDSSSDRHIFAGSESDIMRILSGRTYKFNILSQRFRNPVFVGRLPCNLNKSRLTLDEEEYTLWESIQEFSMMGRKDCPVVLVSSFEEKKIIAAHLGLKMKCITYGESTGLNFQKGAILVTYESALTSDRRWWTALSRFSHDIHFINGMGVTWDNALTHFVGKPLHKFLTKRACNDDIIDLLPGRPELIEGFQSQVGADEGVREAKLVGDPWLKTKIFLGQSPDFELDDFEEVQAAEDWFKTHVPIMGLEAVRAQWVSRLLAKEDREFRIGDITTEQFTDEHSKNRGLELTNAAERYEAIYPRHKGTDTATFLMAVKKRLSFSSPAAEHAKLRRARPFGKFLLDTFLKRVPLDRKHSSEMMEFAVHAFEEKKLSKSMATIENHSGRSCEDWPIDKALIFMKSQLCTKFDNRFRSAKAGQTLACFQHSVLCRFAPYMRYIEAKVVESLPKNLYIHSGKNIDDLADWVKIHKFNGVCTESDYEAFDASQDHFILAFELEVMNYLGLPADLISDYTFIKTHLGSKLGNFAIMRFTGEASTFLFNTMANMLFTFLRYDLNGKEAICFAGDDMCANSRLKITNKNSKFLDKIKLKAKVQFTVTPTFCGWGLCEHGVFKKPDLVLERLQIARETRNLENCIDNYAIEVSCAYQMGENLNLYLSPHEMDAHYNCVRFIILHNHLLKSNIKDLFRGEPTIVTL
uniref:ORF1 protein n=1 Tax=Foveavirus latensarmeniacae TaxID=75387 RepID=A0A679GCG1_9VIRU|nr:RNA-dependent RNA polymerase [Apricot latent virus]